MDSNERPPGPPRDLASALKRRAAFVGERRRCAVSRKDRSSCAGRSAISSWPRRRRMTSSRLFSTSSQTSASLSRNLSVSGLQRNGETGESADSQEVCPHNHLKFVQITCEEVFWPWSEVNGAELMELMSLSQEEFSNWFRKSPVKRANRRGCCGMWQSHRGTGEARRSAGPGPDDGGRRAADPRARGVGAGENRVPNRVDTRNGFGVFLCGCKSARSGDGGMCQVGTPDVGRAPVAFRRRVGAGKQPVGDITLA